MFNYIHRIDGATVNEVLIHNVAFKVEHNLYSYVLYIVACTYPASYP